MRNQDTVIKQPNQRATSKHPDIPIGFTHRHISGGTRCHIRTLNHSMLMNKSKHTVTACLLSVSSVIPSSIDSLDECAYTRWICTTGDVYRSGTAHPSPNSR